MLRLISQSTIMDGLLETIKRIAVYDADILVCGETGTGKEVVARLIHDKSERKHHNFVAINCCAIPDDIIESELFGHEPGAFTGANQRRIGKIEHSDGGTLFLDEIDSMSVSMQTKLLRVLQERQVERLGSNEIIPVDLRIVASTKKDLKQASLEGSFREDLYYRLNVVTIDIPPLRERPDDILILFQYFAGLASIKHKAPVPILTPKIVEQLLVHKWQGNVRELKNVAERFTLGCEINISTGEIPLPVNDMADQKKLLSLLEKVCAYEKALIERELTDNDWNIQRTYSSLQMPRKTLYERMKKIRIVPP